MQVEWKKVTWYSNIIAVIVFVAAWVVGFYVGVKWEQAQIGNSLIQTPVVQTPGDPVPEDNGIGEAPE